MAAIKHIAKRLCVIALALALSWSPAAQADDSAPLYGRPSALEGRLAVKGTTEQEWSNVELNGIVGDGDALLTEPDSLAEIELPRDLFFRLGGSTQLEIVSVGDARYRLLVGSAYVVSQAPAEIVTGVETPSCDIVVGGGSVARIEVSEAGTARIHAVEGYVEVLGEGGSSVALRRELVLTVSPEGGFAGLGPMAPVLADELAQFHLARTAALAGKVLPEPAPYDVVGTRDLAASGDWVVEEEVRYWKPRVVGASWRPYYDGSWRHMVSVGWYWVPRYSFEYVTCHYGYWHRSHRHGWLWRPSWVWSPARVAWVVVDDGICWAPVDIYHHPIVSYRPVAPVSFRFSIGDGDWDLSLGLWCFGRFDDFHRDRPHYTVVRKEVVIRDGMINIGNSRLVNNIDHLNIVRPEVGRRGPRYTIARDDFVRFREREVAVERRRERRPEGLETRLADLRGRSRRDDAGANRGQGDRGRQSAGPDRGRPPLEARQDAGRFGGARPGIDDRGRNRSEGPGRPEGALSRTIGSDRSGRVVDRPEPEGDRPQRTLRLGAILNRPEGVAERRAEPSRSGVELRREALERLRERRGSDEPASDRESLGQTFNLLRDRSSSRDATTERPSIRRQTLGKDIRSGPERALESILQRVESSRSNAAELDRTRRRLELPSLQLRRQEPSLQLRVPSLRRKSSSSSSSGRSGFLSGILGGSSRNRASSSSPSSSTSGGRSRLRERIESRSKRDESSSRSSLAERIDRRGRFSESSRKRGRD